MTRLRIRPLLWFDCAAAAVAGVAMLALSGLLAPLFGVARHWLVMTALVNVGYAGFSYSLARQAEASRRSVLALVVANFTWTGVCVALALLFAAPGSWLGAGYMLAEGLFVAGLAAAEAWAWRGKQQAASSKQQAANSKQQTASSKQQAANSKQQTASSKQPPQPNSRAADCTTTTASLP